MTADDLFKALQLPEATHVHQRVPKKMLAEHAAATPNDRRTIQDQVEEIVWLASLKPHLVGVSAYEDGERQYLEVAVLSLAVKATQGQPTRAARLVELLHRAVPYPVLLITTSQAGLGLSLAHLRASQNEPEKTVLDGELTTVMLPSGSVVAQGFLAAMALQHQPQTDLRALYQGWLDTLNALDIAHETGAFKPSLGREEAAKRHQALLQCRDLQAHLQQLRTLAQRECQMARQVALNQELRAGQAALQQLQQRLNGVPM